MLDLGLLLVRVVLGGYVAAHGVQKLTHLWGGGGLEASSREFRHDGFVGGRLTAFAGGASQLAGGVLVLLGALTPLGAVLVIAPMTIAVTVKIPVGFWSQDGGWEYPSFLALLAVAVAWTGPGALSVDAAVGVLPLYAAGAWAVPVAAGATVAGVGGALLARAVLHHPDRVAAA